MDIKSSTVIFIFAITTFWTLSGVSSQQCRRFDEILEENFDRNYSSIIQDGRRPLGFVKDTAYYDVDVNDRSKKDPCYFMEDLDDMAVEIMFETIPPTYLCFRDQLGKKRCSDTRHQECILSPAARMEYTFYVNVGAGSSETDITFWLRIYRGPPRDDDTEGMWCQWRDNEYPEDLNDLPPYVTPASTARPPDSATSLCASSLLLALSLLLSFISR